MFVTIFLVVGVVFLGIRCVIQSNEKVRLENQIARLSLKNGELLAWQQKAWVLINNQATQVEYARLQIEAVKKQKAASPVPQNMINDLIALTHPDKHGDSKRSTRVFQELQALKGK